MQSPDKRLSDSLQTYKQQLGIGAERGGACSQSGPGTPADRSWRLHGGRASAPSKGADVRHALLRKVEDQQALCGRMKLVTLRAQLKLAQAHSDFMAAHSDFVAAVAAEEAAEADLQASRAQVCDAQRNYNISEVLMHHGGPGDLVLSDSSVGVDDDDAGIPPCQTWSTPDLSDYWLYVEEEEGEERDMPVPRFCNVVGPTTSSHRRQSQKGWVKPDPAAGLWVADHEQEEQRGFAQNRSQEPELQDIPFGSTIVRGPAALKPLPPGATTLIVRNTPRQGRNVRDNLIKLWPPVDCFNFIYVPFSKGQHRWTQYAFMNFLSHEIAVAFRQRWHGYSFDEHGHSSRLDVGVAKVQGLEENLRRCSPQLTEKEEFQPAIFDGDKKINFNDAYEFYVCGCGKIVPL